MAKKDSTKPEEIKGVHNPKTERRRLTEEEKKKVIATYLNVGTYDETARRTGFSRGTVKNVVAKDPDFIKKYNKKREQEAMELFGKLSIKSKEFSKFCDVYFDVLTDEETVRDLATRDLEKVTRIFAIMIDKYMLINNFRVDKVEGESSVNITIVRKNKKDGDESDG